MSKKKPEPFSEEFFQNLPLNNIKSLEIIRKAWDELILCGLPKQASGKETDSQFEYFNVIGFKLIAFSESRSINIGEWKCEMTFDITQVSKLMEAMLMAEINTQKRRRVRDGVEKYMTMFGEATIYKFADHEYDKIQNLITELRTEISRSTILTDKHKRRLLLRLEAMQSELHVETTSIDEFWAFLGMAGITAKQFGKDLKPITDRVETLGKIVIAVVAAHEGIKALPNIVKLLGK